MIFKTSHFAIQEKNLRESDNPKDYPTLADLMRDQNVSSNKANTVHRRRDLDALG